MRKHTAKAIVLIAACAISTGAIGQKVYRCGNEYSQTPCNDGITVNVHDTRNTIQKMESDALIQQESIRATAMEKERLREEARSQTTSAPAAVVKTGSSETKDKKTRTPKKNNPEFFTARVVPTQVQKTKASKSKPTTTP